MRLAFFILLLINLLLFAWQQGVFGTLPESGREPGRIAQQVSPERVRVLVPSEVEQLREKAKQVPDPNAALGLNPIELAAGTACVEFGDFTGDAIGRAQKKLESLGLSGAERVSLRTVDVPGWYMVYIPPAKTRAEVDRRAEELRAAGVKELLVIADNSPMRFGIALGSFRDPDLATKHLEDLRRRGIKDARSADKPSSLPATRLQVKNVDSQLLTALSGAQKEFAQSKLFACGA